MLGVLAQYDDRCVELPADDVVITIDLAMPSRDRPELRIEFQNPVQIAHAGRRDFQFDHNGEGQCNQHARAMQK